jgi:hypothetical protein
MDISLHIDLVQIETTVISTNQWFLHAIQQWSSECIHLMSRLGLQQKWQMFLVSAAGLSDSLVTLHVVTTFQVSLRYILHCRFSARGVQEIHQNMDKRLMHMRFLTAFHPTTNSHYVDSTSCHLWGLVINSVFTSPSHSRSHAFHHIWSWHRGHWYVDFTQVHVFESPSCNSQQWIILLLYAGPIIARAQAHCCWHP